MFCFAFIAPPTIHRAFSASSIQILGSLLKEILYGNLAMLKFHQKCKIQLRLVRGALDVSRELSRFARQAQ